MDLENILLSDGKQKQLTLRVVKIWQLWKNILIGS